MNRIVQLSPALIEELGWENNQRIVMMILMVKVKIKIKKAKMEIKNQIKIEIETKMMSEMKKPMEVKK